MHYTICSVVGSRNYDSFCFECVIKGAIFSFEYNDSAYARTGPIRQSGTPFNSGLQFVVIQKKRHVENSTNIIFWLIYHRQFSSTSEHNRSSAKENHGKHNNDEDRNQHKFKR